MDNSGPPIQPSPEPTPPPEQPPPAPIQPPPPPTPTQPVAPALNVYPEPIDPRENVATEKEVDKVKENGWIKLLRVITWGAVIICISVAVGLLNTSKNASSYANGSYAAKEQWGNILLWVGIIVGLANLAWGAIRWLLRWKRQHWEPGQVAGKLIGGGIWRALVSLPVIIFSLLLITPAIASAITGNVIAEREAALTTSTMKIEAAFSKNEISADEYLTYLVDAGFATDRLPKEFQDDKTIIMPDILAALEENLDSLSAETVEYSLSALNYVDNLAFDTNASGNISRKNGGILNNTVSAATQDVTTLNKAQLSSNERFLIFYTDNGDDAISDEDAWIIAARLENLVDEYERKLGLSYHYEKIDFQANNDWFGKTKISSVLMNSGISPKHLETAMPVYLASPFNSPSNTLAFYAGKNHATISESLLLAIGAIIGVEQANYYRSSPTLPFIGILPENLNDPTLTLIIAHELGHHFTTNYCYDNFNKACSQNDFIDETAPNYMAINIVDEQPEAIEDNLIARYHSQYVDYGSCYPIDTLVPREGNCHDGWEQQGYASVAFLENYAKIAPQGKRVILEALVKDNALEYLHDQAGQNNFREVLMQLAQKTLTNDYGDKYSLYAATEPPGEDLPCYALCSNTYTSKYTTNQYFYFPAEEFKNKRIRAGKADDESLIGISVLGSKSGSWEVIDDRVGSFEYSINEESAYDVIAFAITNYAISGEGNYYIEIGADELDDVVEVEGDSGGLKNCFWFNTSNLLDTLVESGEIINSITGGEVSAEVEQLKSDAAEMEGAGFNKTALCTNPIKDGVSLDEATEKVAKAIGGGFRVSIAGVSMIVNYNPMGQRIQMHGLTDFDGEIWLFSVLMEP